MLGLRPGDDGDLRIDPHIPEALGTLLLSGVAFRGRPYDVVARGTEGQLTLA
jgi:hypothetical protein